MIAHGYFRATKDSDLLVPDGTEADAFVQLAGPGVDQLFARDGFRDQVRCGGGSLAARPPEGIHSPARRLCQVRDGGAVSIKHHG